MTFPTRPGCTHLYPASIFCTQVLICTPMHSQVILACMSQTWSWSLQMDKWDFPHILDAHAHTQHASLHTSADMHSNTFTSNLSAHESNLIMVTSEWKNELSHASWTHTLAPSIHLCTVLIYTPMHSQVILSVCESNLITVTSKCINEHSHTS